MRPSKVAGSFKAAAGGVPACGSVPPASRAQTSLRLAGFVFGVAPGSVTAFGVINDSRGAVKVVLDEALMRHDVINAHPLTNEATTSIGRDDLLRFIRATGHEPHILKLSA
jgi:hypothetical protein